MGGGTRWQYSNRASSSSGPSSGRSRSPLPRRGGGGGGWDQYHLPPPPAVPKRVPLPPPPPPPSRSSASVYGYPLPPPPAVPTVIVVPQPPSVPVHLKPRESIDAKALQLQTKPMPKTAVGTVGSSAKPKGPKVIKVQQKKMPRPRKPPGPAPAAAPTAKTVPIKRMPVRRAASLESWDDASVVSAATLVVPRPMPKAKGSVSTQLQSLWHRLTGRPGSEAVESAASSQLARMWEDVE